MSGSVTRLISVRSATTKAGFVSAIFRVLAGFHAFKITSPVRAAGAADLVRRRGRVGVGRAVALSTRGSRPGENETLPGGLARVGAGGSARAPA